MPTQPSRLASHSWRSDVRLHTTRHGRSGESYDRNNRLSRKNLSWGWESCRRPMRTNRESWRPWGRSVMFYINSCWAYNSQTNVSQTFYWKLHVLFLQHFKFNFYFYYNPCKISPSLENFSTTMRLEKPVFSHAWNGKNILHLKWKDKVL